MTSQYKLSLLPAFIFTLVMSCAGDRAESANRSPVSTGGVAARSQESMPILDAKSAMDGVRRAYSNVVYYRSKGVNRERSVRDGSPPRDQPELPFEIEYSADGTSVIQWKQNDRERVFKIRGNESWLDVDGKRSQSFTNLREGLETISMAEGGRFLFYINVFVFRNEYQLGDRFFVALQNPELKGEEAVDGHPCSVLTGTHLRGEGRTTYWIDKETSLIRRIQTDVIVRGRWEEGEYVVTGTTTEDYSDIEVRYGPDDGKGQNTFPSR